MQDLYLSTVVLVMKHYFDSVYDTILLSKTPSDHNFECVKHHLTDKVALIVRSQAFKITIGSVIMLRIPVDILQIPYRLGFPLNLFGFDHPTSPFHQF